MKGDSDGREGWEWKGEMEEKGGREKDVCLCSDKFCSHAPNSDSMLVGVQVRSYIKQAIPQCAGKLLDLLHMPSRYIAQQQNFA